MCIIQNDITDVMISIYVDADRTTDANMGMTTTVPVVSVPVSYTVRESERVYSRRRKQYGKKTKINLFV